MTKVVTLRLDDWEAIYIDGRKVFEHHEMDKNDLLDKLGIENETIYDAYHLADDPDMGIFPKVLPDNYNEHSTWKTPREWGKEFGIEVMDPDGWRGADSKDFGTPLSLEEYSRRLMISTIQIKGSGWDKLTAALDTDRRD